MVDSGKRRNRRQRGREVEWGRDGEQGVRRSGHQRNVEGGVMICVVLQYFRGSEVEVLGYERRRDVEKRSIWRVGNTSRVHACI